VVPASNAASLPRQSCNSQVGRDRGKHKSCGDFLSNASADLAQTANVVETDGRNLGSGSVLRHRQLRVEKNANGHVQRLLC